MTWSGLIEHHTEVDSTMALAKDKALAGAPEGFTVWADRQTQGRGRHGRIWHSPAGEGLYFTTLLRPPQSSWPIIGAHTATLSLLSAVVLARVLRALGVDEIGLKWPNDVFVAGQKCAGILLECVVLEPQKSLILLGMGVNLAPATKAHQDLDFHYGYVGLQELLSASGACPSTQALLEQILGEFEEAYGIWLERGFEAFALEWQEYDWLAGKEITASYQSRQVSGIAQGVNAYGQLKLHLDGKMVEIDAGEVHLV